ncbi:ROK family protein [bacterium]|nr:ROK family protein [bacterium]
MNRAIGIDIGGTKISYALIDNNGELKSRVEKIPTPKSAEEIANVLKDIIKQFEEQIEFVAIATAGAVNNENTAIIGSTANMPFRYKDINFQSLSSKKVFVENDANCAAWAEYRIGASKNCKNSVMLTLGTGVGGGIIINGKLLKGKSGSAGEMHFAMSRDKKRKCTCGAWDCFEIYASGNGLRLTGVEVFNDENITTYDIIEKAKNGNEMAKKALEIWQNDIALGILGLNNLFDADCFVLSGSMAEFVDIAKLTEVANRNTVCKPTVVFRALAGNYAGMIGAVLLANELL